MSTRLIVNADTLSLRAYRPEDADVLADLLNNKEVVAFTARIPFPYARSDAQAFIEKASKETKTLSRSIALDGANHSLVGGMGYGLRREGGAREIGYWVGRPYWGLGIASEALRQFLALMSARGVSGPILAQTARENIASQRVLEKNGFARDGEDTCETPAREAASMPSYRFLLHLEGKGAA